MLFLACHSKKSLLLQSRAPPAWPLLRSPPPLTLAFVNRITRVCTFLSRFNLLPSSHKERPTLPFDPKATPWRPPPRATSIARAKSEKFDVVVIGGGCVGTGIAVDALSRGLSVALIERDDFAAGTSSRSTKLIHGGVRYLEQAFKSMDLSLIELVTEALEERSFMLESMPFMAKPLPIMYVPHSHTVFL